MWGQLCTLWVPVQESHADSEHPHFRTPGNELANCIPGHHPGTVPSIAIPVSSRERQILRSHVQLPNGFPWLTQFHQHTYAN